MKDELLTLQEASSVLRISAATLRGWVFYRKIDHVKLNGAIRFRRDDLNRMIDSCTRPANQDHVA